MRLAGGVNYLFELFGNQRERLVDGVCGARNGDDALGTGAVRYVDDGARLKRRGAKKNNC